MRVGFDNSGTPLTVTGSLGLGGELDLQGIVLKSAQFGVGLGGPNAYLFAKAAGKMEIGGFPLAAEAALFVGKAATLDPIKKVNPEIASIITGFGFGSIDGTDPIYGAYVYGYGQFSVLNLLGIPATPLLDLQVGGGTGYYLFYQGGDVATGLQQVYSISGEVLCLVSVSGRLDTYLAFANNLNSPSFAGTKAAGIANAKLSGELGIDPFSVSWSKNFRFATDFDASRSPKFKTSVDF